MDETPEREASAKLAQHLAVAVQVAEAVIRLRQHGLERHAAASAQAAAAARAERAAQHAADRVGYHPALDRDWVRTAGLTELGRAWGAAAGWADTDPAAHVAATRIETRLAEMAPTAMTRYQQLRDTGADRVGAMRDVLTHLAAESHARAAGPRVFVADAGPAGQATQQQAAQARRTTGAGYRHPADAAADSFPRPYTTVTPAAAGAAAAARPAAGRGKTRALTR